MSLLVNRTSLTDEARSIVEGALAGIADIGQLATFAREQHPPLQFPRKIDYEDGSYDLFATRPSDRHVLVFSVDQSACIRVATIWDRMPSDRELHSSRLESGLEASPRRRAALT